MFGPRGAVQRQLQEDAIEAALQRRSVFVEAAQNGHDDVLRMLLLDMHERGEQGSDSLQKVLADSYLAASAQRHYQCMRTLLDSAFSKEVIWGLISKHREEERQRIKAYDFLVVLLLCGTCFLLGRHESR